MANEGLKKFFAEKLVGVQPDRIAARTQGCWNCIHSDPEAAAKLWWEKARAELLGRAMKIALNSPKGEKHPKVYAIRQQVPLMDAQMEAKQWIRCTVGRKPDGSALADFVNVGYLCDRWTGRSGASQARQGAAPDKLPEELMERFVDDGKTD